MHQFCPTCGQPLERKNVEGRERLYCKRCSKIKWQNPKPVAWTLLQKDKEYLLVKRAENPDKGEWDIPGGFLEVDESFEEAAVRELKEETNIEASEEGIEFLDTLAFERSGEYVVGNVFYKEVENITGIEASDDAEEARFWSKEEILKTKNEDLRDVCEEVLAKLLD